MIDIPFSRLGQTEARLQAEGGIRWLQRSLSALWFVNQKYNYVLRLTTETERKQEVHHPEALKILENYNLQKSVSGKEIFPLLFDESSDLSKAT